MPHALAWLEIGWANAASACRVGDAEHGIGCVRRNQPYSHIDINSTMSGVLDELDTRGILFSR